MDNFLQYFYQDIGRVFRAFVDIFAAFFNFINYLFNFPMRMEIIKSYESEFNTTSWILLLIANLVLIGISVLLVILLIKGLKKVFRLNTLFLFQIGLQILLKL